MPENLLAAAKTLLPKESTDFFAAALFLDKLTI
jgi:hypothetical protein